MEKSDFFYTCPHCGNQLAGVPENAEIFQCPHCLEIINPTSQQTQEIENSSTAKTPQSDDVANSSAESNPADAPTVSFLVVYLYFLAYTSLGGTIIFSYWVFINMPDAYTPGVVCIGTLAFGLGSAMHYYLATYFSNLKKTFSI